MGTEKGSIQRRRPRRVIRKGLGEFLPTSVQKSYFLLSDSARGVFNSALEKYRPGQSEPILVGGENLLKPALRLMIYYGGGCPDERRGKSGSVSDIQSGVPAHLVRIQEAPHRVCCPEACQVRSNEVSEIGKMRQISFPAEEPSTDLFLEFLNRPSQCWRGYVAFFGRPTEVQQFTHRQEVRVGERSHRPLAST